MAELQLPKLTTRVRFPSSAPQNYICHAFIAQSVERIHGKDEVTSSILVKGSNEDRCGCKLSRFLLFQPVFVCPVFCPDLV